MKRFHSSCCRIGVSITWSPIHDASGRIVVKTEEIDGEAAYHGEGENGIELPRGARLEPVISPGPRL